MTYSEAMAFIDSFGRHGAPVRDLNRIEALLELIGGPHKKQKFIHIAGTNGKGSVAEMCSNILIDAGFKVGLFTSPYIVEYSDRIRVNGENISKASLCETVSQIKSVIDRLDYKKMVSQFEITTAIAFLHFKKMHCDISVLEAGIGGLLDSTNVIKAPLVSVITSISYDHTSILGNTLEEISFQKAGIIKPGCPCVLSVKNPPEVVSVIKNAANNNKSELIVPEMAQLTVLKKGIAGNEFVYNEIGYKTAMGGTHQIINALSVIEAMAVLVEKGYLIKSEHIISGIVRTRVYSRAEIISKEPLIILDGSHNTAGMSALADMVRDCKKSIKMVVVGMLRDKDYKKAIAEIIPAFDEFICVDGFHSNAVSAREIAEAVKAGGKMASVTADVSLVIEGAKRCKLSKDAMAVVCGSLYLTSRLRSAFFE